MTILNESVINAAGKLTALGGSAQTPSVAAAAANAAGLHVDLTAYRSAASEIIARLTTADAACITTGAAAGITISCAAVLCQENPTWITRLPVLPNPRFVLLQAGHNINFGAAIEQMIRLSGATPLIAGTIEAVSTNDLLQQIEAEPGVAALLYVKSHHCIQENRVSLAEMVVIARQCGIPLIVDAAAEEDLTFYIQSGADLVTYSGGKAFCGPTSGFIAGRQDLIDLCEDQFKGIARTMKVGKEQIAGLIQAMVEFAEADDVAHQHRLQVMNGTLLAALDNSTVFSAYLKPDEAGRDFSRVAVTPKSGQDPYSSQALVRFLESASPSIRTRNHQIKNDIVLIDPRELDEPQLHKIIERLGQFEHEQLTSQSPEDNSHV